MKNFVYKKPKTIKEASQFMGENWIDALPLAGGTDLLGLMKNEIETPNSLVNLKSIPGMDQITYSAGKGLTMGALVTITEIAEHPIIGEKYTVLAQAAQEIASPQLRNQATIGGNICQRPRCWYFRGDFYCLKKGGDLCYAVDGENKYHCVIGGGPCFIVHPSDIAVALMALDASIVIAAGKKSRVIPITQFFILPEKNVTRENVLNPGEIITEIRLSDAPVNMRSRYLKMKERQVWDFAIVSVAGVIQMDTSTIQTGRIALGGVAPVPWLERNVTAKLAGAKLSEENLTEIAAVTLSDADTLEQNEYKIPLARNLVKRLLRELSI